MITIFEDTDELTPRTNELTPRTDLNITESSITSNPKKKKRKNKKNKKKWAASQRDNLSYFLRTDNFEIIKINLQIIQ